MRKPWSDSKWVITFTLLIPVFLPKVFFGYLPGPFEAHHGDTFKFFEPYALEFIRALESGENPFWSHTSSFGSPTLLTLGTGALHPFHALHLALPDWMAFAVGTWLRIAVCGAYLFLYLRLQKVVPWIAMASTTSFLFGSFNINYASEIIGYVMCFFPMMLYYTAKLCRNSELTGDTIACLALSTFLVLLGGFPSVVLYLFLAIAVYAILHAGHWTRLLLICIACMIGVLAALPMISETLTFFPSTGYDPAQRKWLYFYDPPADTALNLFIPSVFGGFLEYGAAGMKDFFGSQLGAGLLAIPALLILFPRLLASGQREESSSYFWTGVLIFSLGLYFNVGGIKTPISNIPVISEHPFTRLQTLIALSATLASAMAIDQFIKLKPSKIEWSAAMIAIGAILAVAYGVALTQIANLTTTRYLLIFGSLSIFTLVSLGASYFWQTPWARNAFLLSCASVCLATSWTYLRYYQPQEYYATTPTIKHIQTSLVAGARIIDLNDAVFKGAAIAYGVPSMTNHWFSQPELRKWVQQLSSGATTAGLTLDRIASIRLPGALPDLRQMHVQFVVGRRGSIQRLGGHGGADWREIDTGDDALEVIEVLYEGRPLVSAEGIPGQGYKQFQLHHGDIGLLLQAQTATIPVRFDPGWTSSTPGVELARSSRHLIQLTAPAGTGEVKLSYRPALLHASVGWGALGILFLISVAIAVLRYTRALQSRQAIPL